MYATCQPLLHHERTHCAWRAALDAPSLFLVERASHNFAVEYSLLRTLIVRTLTLRYNDS